MPRATGASKDFDLSDGRFRFDLRTALLLAALLGSWYDGRSQQAQQALEERLVRDKQAAVDQQQAKAVADALSEVKRLQMAQAYDVRQIIVALAERGIVIKETAK